MGKIRYTVTTITKQCPYCGRTVDTETHGEFAPFLGILFLFTFPIVIPYWLLKHLAFQDPNFPKIGPETTPCPHCSLPIRTENYAIEDLKDEKLFLHKFKKWIYISYVFGAICGSCIFGMITGAAVVSLWGLFALLSLIAVVIIIITYHVKLEEIAHPKSKVIDQPSSNLKHTSQDNTVSFFYCRKCGNKLPADSQFCNKCGTELVK